MQVNSEMQKGPFKLGTNADSVIMKKRQPKTPKDRNDKIKDISSVQSVIMDQTRKNKKGMKIFGSHTESTSRLDYNSNLNTEALKNF